MLFVCVVVCCGAGRGSGSDWNVFCRLLWSASLAAEPAWTAGTTSCAGHVRDCSASDDRRLCQWPHLSSGDNDVHTALIRGLQHQRVLQGQPG